MLSQHWGKMISGRPGFFSDPPGGVSELCRSPLCVSAHAEPYFGKDSGLFSEIAFRDGSETYFEIS